MGLLLLFWFLDRARVWETKSNTELNNIITANIWKQNHIVITIYALLASSSINWKVLYFCTFICAPPLRQKSIQITKKGRCRYAHFCPLFFPFPPRQPKTNKATFYCLLTHQFSQDSTALLKGWGGRAQTSKQTAWCWKVVFQKEDATDEKCSTAQFPTPVISLRGFFLSERYL